MEIFVFVKTPFKIENNQRKANSVIRCKYFLLFVMLIFICDKFSNQNTNLLIIIPKLDTVVD